MKQQNLSLIKMLFGVLLLLIMIVSSASAQVSSIPDTSKMKYNEISSKLKLYVFPGKNQSQATQKSDEFECYKWAVEQSGIDPLNMPQVKTAPEQTGPDGSAVKGAAKGAIVGVAVGSIGGEAGKGAAAGAVVGAAGGIRQKKVGQAKQQQESQANAAAQEQAIKDSFTKAFSACIEGKGYTVK
jgi:hypothetical protein